MQTVVINLESRTDRLEAFKKNNPTLAAQARLMPAVDGKTYTYGKLLKEGYDTDKDWRDPILKRTLTWGEVGCFLSHYEIWKLVAESEEPVLVLEDDAILKVSLSEIERLLGNNDLLYVAHNEMCKDGVVKLSDELVRPCYPYWTSAYAITPRGAQILLDSDISRNIIPVDEYMPRMLSKMKAVACEPQLAVPVSRSVLGTDVEPNGNERAYVRDFTVHVLTCGDDEKRMSMLNDSAKAQGFDVQNVLFSEWEGGTMEGPGGGQKINELLSFFLDNDLPDNDVVLFTDAFDVFFYRSLDTIVGRFLGFKHEIVFSAEQFLWPDKSLRFPPTHTKYRYLNSGTFIGRVGEIKRMADRFIENYDDDQLYLQKAFLSGRYDACLDTEGYIFQTNEEACEVKNGTVFNPITRCFGCVYHGNGGDSAKQTLERLYKGVYRELIYSVSKDFEVIGPEMLLIDFLTPSQCQEWIDISEKHGGWNPHYADKFPSHDIHLKELGLWDDFEYWWSKVAGAVTGKYWPPSHHHHVRKAFTMKYSADTQKTLGFHNDASLVTGSVKLNDDYEGATLVFPRQKITNANIPIGKMILFPGQLTHGHHVTELTQGTKFSFTAWTARFQGDLLNPE